jgi:prepilin-type N-terminal cleavage/methylation domain-containing protein
MKLFYRFRRFARHRRRYGFTLIEVLMAMMLTASMTGLLISSVVNAMSMRQKALSLGKAVTLAKKKMHEIKALNKTDSGQGEFPGMPGYSFAYTIREQELDLQKIADELGAGKEVANSAAAKYFKERTSSARSATGLTFKLLHFHVEVSFSDKDKYELDYYRGLGI